MQTEPCGSLDDVDALSECVASLFDSPDTLLRLSCADLEKILTALRRNQLFVGVTLGSVNELEGGEGDFSLFGKNTFETKTLMQQIKCAFTTHDRKLVNTVEDGTFAHYEQLLLNEKAMVQEQILRFKLKLRDRPAWVAWLNKSESSLYAQTISALERYEHLVIKTIDDLRMMYDTLIYPAFSARVALESLLLKRPVPFNDKSET